MTALFQILNLFVAPVWLLAILAPRSRLTLRVLGSPQVVALPIAVYGVLVLPRLGELLPLVARPELHAIVSLLGTPEGTTIAWAHFLAFDLWVGRFIVLDARRRAAPMPTLALSLILALTLLLGPLGLAAYGLACVQPVRRARAFLALSARSSPALTRLGVGSLAVGILSAIMQLIDARQLGGVSVWLKPTKFGVSIAIAAFTLSLLLPAIDVAEKTRRRGIFTITAGMALELLIIAGQSARGVPSHFNAATLLDGVLFEVMGVAIVLVTAAFAVFAWRALRTHYADRALGAGIRSGLAIMLLGSSIAFLMTHPTASQLESLAAGRPTPAIGAHAVNAPDDARGLPGTGWNTLGGDLRAPHFVGLHALQLMPLIGFYLGRRRGVSATLALRLTRISAFGYLGIVVTTLVQALRGQPVLGPDGVTLAMLAVVAAGCSGAALLAFIAERSASLALRNHVVMTAPS